MVIDPFAAVRCARCGLVHWPQLPCLDEVERRRERARIREIDEKFAAMLGRRDLERARS